ncbi:MAG: hypothetical protein PHY72_00145 [Candidatus Pacebacteria bacterium]|nr:hypothetical protein [Candidatus Paceibacterota bacterium]
MTKPDLQIEDLQKAIARLDEVLKLEKTDIVRDSAIHRFELVSCLVWAYTYKDEVAEMVYADLPVALENFKKLLEKISVPLK